MGTEFQERLADALAEHIFPILSEVGLGDDPYYYVEENVSGEEDDGTVVIHIEAPGRETKERDPDAVFHIAEDGGLTVEGAQARDRLLVLLYEMYSEECWRAGWMAWSEATRRGFATWLATESGLDQGATPFADYEAEALPALREVWREVGARWLS